MIGAWRSSNRACGASPPTYACDGDIGFVGRSPGKYQIYVGGDFEGTHLNSLIADLVPVEELAARLRPLFVHFRDHGALGEGFGAYCHRVGVDALRELAFPEQAPVAASR